MLNKETNSLSYKQLRPAGENTQNEVNQNKMTRLTNSIVTPIEQQRNEESNENPESNLQANIDGRQIPSQNIYQGDCNLEEMI